MKTYQIYVDSANGAVRSAQPSIHDYKFDWNILPEGEYEMSFSFVSQIQKLTNTEAEADTYALTLEIDIPFSGNNYKVNLGSIGFSGGTHASGLLEIKDQHKTSSHTMRLLVSDTKLNTPITLYGKPQGMDFNITLLKHGGGFAINPPLYNMVIFLKHIC